MLGWEVSARVKKYVCEGEAKQYSLWDTRRCPTETSPSCRTHTVCEPSIDFAYGLSTVFHSKRL